MVGSQGGFGVRCNLDAGPVAFWGVDEGGAVVDGGDVLFQFEELESGEGGEDVLKGGDCLGVKEGVEVVEAADEFAGACLEVYEGFGVFLVGELFGGTCEGGMGVVVEGVVGGVDVGDGIVAGV